MRGGARSLRKSLASIGWRTWSKVEQIAEAGAERGIGQEVAPVAGSLQEPLLESRAYLGLAKFPHSRGAG